MPKLLCFRTKNIFQLLITLAAFAPLVTSDGAEPSNGISKLMKTPATVSDVFLFRLYEQSKCPNQVWFGVPDPNISSDVCMTSIEYDYYHNLLVMNFAVGYDYKKLQGLRDKDSGEREGVLKAMISDLAKAVGAEPRDIGPLKKRFGMFQTTPIMGDWIESGLDSNQVRDEIANVTVIHLRLPFERGANVVTRDQDGKVTFEEETVKFDKR